MGNDLKDKCAKVGLGMNPSKTKLMINENNLEFITLEDEMIIKNVKVNKHL